MVVHGPYNPPDHVPTAMWYNRRRMQDRPISEGREVHLNNFPLRNFKIQIERLGWNAFMLVGGLIYPRLVEEFYSHFVYDDDGRVIFIMFRDVHNYSLSEFATLLGIPCVEDQYPLHFVMDDLWRALCRPEIPFNEQIVYFDGIREDYLQEQYVVPNEIIRSNVFHREEGDSKLSITEQKLLYCLNHGIPMNMAHVVAARMNRLHYQPERPLPYGALLTRLFMRIGVVRDGIPKHPISTRPIGLPIYEIPSDDETPPVVEEQSSDSDTSSTRSDARSYIRIR